MNIAEALKYNCPVCVSGIGVECISLARGEPMSRFYHRGRVPNPVSSADRIKLRTWLQYNADILVFL